MFSFFSFLLYLVFVVVSGLLVFVEVGLLDDRSGSVLVFVLSSLFVLGVWIVLIIWGSSILSKDDDDIIEGSEVIVSND